MELRNLRTFVTVAELGTVSQAAERLHVAQPALSRQIMALEEDLGVALFDRMGGRLVLSSAGRQLLGDCRGLLDVSRELKERARSLGRPDAGVLKVAASPHYIDSVLPEFLRRYRKRYPDVRVALMDIVGYDTVGLLERGEIQVAQAAASLLRPGDAHVGHLPLPPVEMVAACRPETPLPPGDTVEITSLAGMPLLQTGSEYVIRRTFDAACRLAGFEPQNMLESRAPHALLSMAESGHGVAIIPSAVRVHRYRLRIARIAYRRKVLSEPLALLYDRRRAMPPYTEAFCEMLAAYAHAVFPITRPGGPKR